MNKSIEIKFEVYQRVKITELNRPAYVECITYDGSAVMYKVSYWLDGERKIAWVYAHEIESVSF